MRVWGYLSLAITYLARFILPAVQIILFIALIFSMNSFFLLSLLAILFVNLMLYLIFNFKYKITSPVKNNMLKQNDSDVLLLISPGEIKKSSFQGRFDIQNWSAAWINTLEQEMGYFSVSDNIEDMKDKKAIIISSSMPDIDPTFIEKNAKKGKIIIVEKPNHEIASYFGIKILKGNARAKKITSEFLKGAPLNCDFDIIYSKDFKILMEIDKKPAIISRNIGKGEIIFILFECSKQLISLQQGVPEDNYSVRHKYGLPGLIEPVDMLFSKELLDNEVPYADILEKFIINLLDTPKWGKLPPNHRSALILSHDEDYCDEQFIKMIEEEIKIGIHPTLFATPLKTTLSKYLKYMTKNSVDVGVHWDKFPNELFFRKNPSHDLSNQIKLLKTKVLSSRIHFLKWGSHYTNTFRLLTRNGIWADSTYGNNFGKGYAFSTSYFFHPVDTNGNLMPILELPFEIMEKRGNADLRYIESIIMGNDKKYNGVLCFNFHPGRYEYSKDFRKMIFEVAVKNKILIFSLREYYDFYNDRVNSSIKTSGNKITINAKTKLKLILPHHIKKIKVNEKNIHLNRMENSYGIVINKGKHVLYTK